MAEHKIKALLTEYNKWLGYDPSWGKEVSGAKRLIDSGYTTEEVHECYLHFKSQNFWQDKHLSLQYIASNIGAWRKNNQLTRPETEDDPYLDKWFRENNKWN